MEKSSVWILDLLLLKCAHTIRHFTMETLKGTQECDEELDFNDDVALEDDTGCFSDSSSTSEPVSSIESDDCKERSDLEEGEILDSDDEEEQNSVDRSDNVKTKRYLLPPPPPKRKARHECDSEYRRETYENGDSVNRRTKNNENRLYQDERCRSEANYQNEQFNKLYHPKRTSSQKCIELNKNRSNAHVYARINDNRSWQNRRNHYKSKWNTRWNSEEKNYSKNRNTYPHWRNRKHYFHQYGHQPADPYHCDAKWFNHRLYNSDGEANSTTKQCSRRHYDYNYYHY